MIVTPRGVVAHVQLTRRLWPPYATDLEMKEAVVKNGCPLVLGVVGKALEVVAEDRATGLSNRQGMS